MSAPTQALRLAYDAGRHASAAQLRKPGQPLIMRALRAGSSEEAVDVARELAVDPLRQAEALQHDAKLMSTLAVTRRHDDEPRISSVYDLYAPAEPTVSIDDFLADGESLEDVDVADTATPADGGPLRGRERFVPQTQVGVLVERVVDRIAMPRVGHRIVVDATARTVHGVPGGG